MQGKSAKSKYMNNLIKREETEVYPHRRWNDRAYIQFPPFVTWIALKSNVLLLISDFSLIICVKYLWRCFRWRSGLKMPCPLPPWIQQVIMQWISKHLTFYFSSSIVIKLFYILLLHIAMYIALLEKYHDHLHDSNSVMHVKCFILNLLRNKDCDAWLFYILWLRW